MLHASEAKASVLQERVIISIILQTSSFPPTHPGFQRVSEGVSGRGKAVAARSSSLVELAYFDRALVGLAVWYKTVVLCTEVWTGRIRSIPAVFHFPPLVKQRSVHY